MIKVAITDDHFLIINGIKELLTQIEDIEFVDGFLNAAETREGLKEKHVDVLLLDINLPDGDGIQLCKELTRAHPQLKIVALTTYNQNVLVKNMMRNGALGYLIKNTSKDELSEAIHAAYADKQYVQPEVKEALLRDAFGTSSQRSSFRPKLTRREKEVLKLITEEFTTQEMADKLFISPKTVETHRLNLLQKFGVRNTAGLVKEAINQGLLE